VTVTSKDVSIVGFKAAALVQRELPELEVKEVRGKTLCSLVSPGTEITGDYLGASFPKFPGYSAIFQVEELGSEVEGIAKGMTLFCPGSHRSVQQVAMDRVVPVPPNLKPEVAVLARLMGVTLTTLMTTVARPGDSVLVIGAGPIGFLAAQTFKQAGYDVGVVEPHSVRRDAVKSSGINRVYESVPVDDADIQGKVALVLECSGNEQAAIQGCRIVRKRGEVVLVGVPWQKRTDATAFDLMSAVFLNYAVLRSGWEWELPWTQKDDFRPWSVMEGFSRCLRWLSEGRIRHEGLVATWKPEDCETLYRQLSESRCQGLFQVFDWRQP